MSLSNTSPNQNRPNSVPSERLCHGQNWYQVITTDTGGV